MKNAHRVVGGSTMSRPLRRRDLDLRITIRWANVLASKTDVLDPEDLAGDMLEEIVRAMLAGRINAPTRRALLLARRFALAARLRTELRADRREEMPDLVEEPTLDRCADRRLSLQRLQALWPDLTDTEREAVAWWLLETDEKDKLHRKVLSNAMARVLRMLRGEQKRNARFVSCGHLGHTKQRAA